MMASLWDLQYYHPGGFERAFGDDLMLSRRVFADPRSVAYYVFYVLVRHNPDRHWSLHVWSGVVRAVIARGE